MLKPNVLIADDEPEVRELLRDLFKDDFSLHFAGSGEEVLSALYGALDVIILDMHLADTSGIELCKHINAMPSDNRPAIVVISGDTSDDLVKAAYELGISDYIGKPFSLVAFHERISKFASDVIALRMLQKRDKENTNLAHTAMTQSADYGRALELVAKLNSCYTPEAIMQTVGSSMLSQGLKVAIQLRAGDVTFNYDVDSITCSEIELQVFEVLKNQGRIYHFGRRTIFNDKHCSILFKNMPFEGTQSYDSVLDVAAKFILAIDARFVSLRQQQAMIAARDTLYSALDMIVEGVTNMELERRDLIKQIETKIGLSFHKLELTDDQEQFFLKLIEDEVKTREKSTNFSGLKKLITQCVDSIKVEDIPDEKEGEINLASSDDIEFF